MCAVCVCVVCIDAVCIRTFSQRIDVTNNLICTAQIYKCMGQKHGRRIFFTLTTNFFIVYIENNFNWHFSVSLFNKNSVFIQWYECLDEMEHNDGECNIFGQNVKLKVNLKNFAHFYHSCREIDYFRTYLRNILDDFLIDRNDLSGKLFFLVQNTYHFSDVLYFWTLQRPCWRRRFVNFDINAKKALNLLL